MRNETLPGHWNWEVIDYHNTREYTLKVVDFSATVLVGPDQQHWQLIIPNYLPSTENVGKNKQLSDLTLILEADQTYDHISARLLGVHRSVLGNVISQVAHDLGEYNHHILLLALAIERKLDIDNGESRQIDEGWVTRDALLTKIGTDDPKKLDQLVHYARQQFRRFALFDPDTIIERRGGGESGQLRIGMRKLQINTP